MLVSHQKLFSGSVHPESVWKNFPVCVMIGCRFWVCPVHVTLGWAERAAGLSSLHGSWDGVSTAVWLQGGPVVSRSHSVRWVLCVYVNYKMKTGIWSPKSSSGSWQVGVFWEKDPKHTDVQRTFQWWLITSWRGHLFWIKRIISCVDLQAWKSAFSGLEQNWTINHVMSAWSKAFIEILLQ